MRVEPDTCAYTGREGFRIRPLRGEDASPGTAGAVDEREVLASEQRQVVFEVDLE